MILYDHKKGCMIYPGRTDFSSFCFFSSKMNPRVVGSSGHDGDVEKNGSRSFWLWCAAAALAACGASGALNAADSDTSEVLFDARCVHVPIVCGGCSCRKGWLSASVPLFSCPVRVRDQTALLCHMVDFLRFPAGSSSAQGELVWGKPPVRVVVAGRGSSRGRSTR